MSNKVNTRPTIIFLGPLPPPHMGPTLATEVLLNSRLAEEFQLIHLDTSDHRPLSTLGAIDLANIYLALKSYVDLIWLIVRHWPRAVYIPISQTTLGYLRDSGHILISRLFLRRVICHLRGGNFSRWLNAASWPTRWYVKTVHRLVHGQIVLGECLRPLFSQILPDKRIHVVPNGKDMELPPRSRADDGQIRVLFLANMIKTKGVLETLHAVPLVVQAFPGAEFHFAGAWNEPDLQQEIEAYLHEHADLPIKWLGSVHGEEKYQLIVDADIYVFPTYYPPEGHPWSIIEAMAAGLPVVSCDQGAVKESVIDGENGFIVQQRSCQAVAEKLIQLCQDAQLRSSMGAASRQRYEDQFTVVCMVEKMSVALQAAMV